MHLRERGAALLMLCFALIALSGVALQQTLSEFRRQVVNESPAIKLQAARDELLALAVNYADQYGALGAGPGHLPCPNTALPDGSRASEAPDPPCGSQPWVIGRVPRQAGSSSASRVTVFQRGPYEHQQALWYVVSGAYVNNPLGTAQIVNPATRGVLSLAGRDDIVALLIDPGPALGAQRRQRPSTMPAAYLEGDNANADAQFATLSGSAGNDRVLSISRHQMMKLVRKRVAAHIQDWLSYWSIEVCGHQDRCFPFAASELGSCVPGQVEGRLPVLVGSCTGPGLLDSDLEPYQPWHRHWFVRNRWPEWVEYSVADECTGGAHVCAVSLEDPGVGQVMKVRVDVLTATS